jgi:hypothetical protein
MNLTRHRLTVGVLWAAFAGLALYFVFTLDLRSLRLDEIFTIRMSDPSYPLSELIRDWMVLEGSAPPLFKILLYFWQALVGSTDVATRAFGLFPYIAGALSIAIAVRHRLLGEELVYFCGLFLTSYGVIWYVEEVRPYALVLCCSLILLLLMLAAIRAVERNESLGRVFWVVLTIVAFTTSLSHYFGLLNAGSTLLCLAWLFFSRHQRREFLGTIILGLAVLASTVAWIIYAREFWVPFIRTFFPEFQPYPIFRDFSRIAFSFNVPLVLAALAALFIRVRELAGDLRIRMVIASAVISVAPAVLISLYTPIIRGRNLIILLPAIYYVIARSFNALGNRASVRALVGMLLLSSGVIALTLNRIPATDWRGSGQWIMAAAGCERGVIPTWPVWGPGEISQGGYLIPTSSVWGPGEILQGRYLDSDGLTLHLATPESIAIAWNQDCPVLLWAGQINRPGLDALMAEMHIPREKVSVEEFRNVYVVVRD